MTLNEKLTLAAIIIGLIISYLTYKKTFSKKDDFELLIEQFKEAKSLSLLVQNYMQILIDKGFGGHFYIAEENITFNASLELMKEYYSRNLSDANFRTMKPSLGKAKIAYYSKGFETQIAALKDIEIRLNILLQKVNSY
jgi:hypothetical protein